MSAKYRNLHTIMMRHVGALSVVSHSHIQASLPKNEKADAVDPAVGSNPFLIFPH